LVWKRKEETKLPNLMTSKEQDAGEKKEAAAGTETAESEMVTV